MDNIKHYKLVSGMDIITEEVTNDQGQIAWVYPFIPRLLPPQRPGQAPTLEMIPLNNLTSQQTFLNINRAAILLEMKLVEKVGQAYKDVVDQMKAAKSGLVKPQSSSLILPK